jgi:hypothetical protein
MRIKAGDSPKGKSMKAQKSRWIALSALVAGLSLASSAQAYWGLDTGPANTVGDSGNAAYTVKMSGFYAANDANNKVTSGNWTSNALTQFAGNGQGMYSGTDNGSPYHALDNNQNTEGVLLSFSASTVLTSIGLGFTSNAEFSCKNNTTQAMTYQSPAAAARQAPRNKRPAWLTCPCSVGSATPAAPPAPTC